MLGFLFSFSARLEATRLVGARLARHAATRRVWLITGLLFLLVAFCGVRSFGLQDNNEGLYAEVGREMLAGGDWVIPHLNGGPYLEKPPLLYWALAGSMRVFGVNEFAVRLVPVLFLGGTLAALAWLGRLARLERRAQAACLILLSGGGYVVMSRSLLFDGPMMCWLAWAMAAFFAWRRHGQRRWLWLFYAALAASVMTKGLVGLVIGGGVAVLATAWLDRSLRAVLRVFDPVGLLILVLLAAPWHVLAAAREPDFLNFYFINEHIRRFLDLREPKDYYTGPVYYYLTRLPIYLGAWIAFLPLLLRGSRLRENFPGNADASPGSERELRVVLWTWWLVPLVFFSLSRAKANYYLLSAVPALAFLLALGWPAMARQTGRRRLVAGSLALVLVGLATPMAVAAVAHYKPELQPELTATAVLLWVLLASVVGLAVAALACALRRRFRAAFWLTVGLGVVPWLTAPALLRETDEALSQRDLARYLAAEMPDARVVLNRDYEKISSLAFYLPPPLAILDSRSDDLLYQQRHGYNRPQFLDDAEFRQLAARGPVALVARPCFVERLLARHRSLGLHVVRAFRSAVVLTADPALAAAAAGRARGG